MDNSNNTEEKLDIKEVVAEPDPEIPAEPKKEKKEDKFLKHDFYGKFLDKPERCDKLTEKI